MGAKLAWDTGTGATRVRTPGQNLPDLERPHAHDVRTAWLPPLRRHHGSQSRRRGLAWPAARCACRTRGTGYLVADAARRHRRGRGSGRGGPARALRGNRHPVGPHRRREPGLVHLRPAGGAATQRLGRPLPRTDAEVVRRPLHGQRCRGGAGAAGPYAGIRCLAMGRDRGAARAHRAVQAPGLRAGDPRLRAVRQTGGVSLLATGVSHGQTPPSEGSGSIRAVTATTRTGCRSNRTESRRRPGADSGSGPPGSGRDGGS